MSGKKHEHRFKIISFSLDIKRPTIISVCRVRGCIETKVTCVLCDEDGNRRKHRGSHFPPKNRELHNRAILALTKAAVEYEQSLSPQELERWRDRER